MNLFTMKGEVYDNKKMLMQNQKLRKAEEIVSRLNNYNTVINLIELNFIGALTKPKGKGILAMM